MYSVASENKTLRTRCRILLYYHCMLIYVKYIYYINLILTICTTSIWVLIPCIHTDGFVKCTPDALFYSIIVFIYFISTSFKIINGCAIILGVNNLKKINCSKLCAVCVYLRMTRQDSTSQCLYHNHKTYRKMPTLIIKHVYCVIMYVK